MTLPVWSGREGRWGVVQAPLAIVWSCALGVSAYAAAGKLVEVPEQVCPSCGGKLGWWSGYWRKLRESGVRVRIWVRRGRCPPCDVTHALLPDFVVERRRYAVEAIGLVLEATAARVSAWKSSEELNLPFATVRDLAEALPGAGAGAAGGALTAGARAGRRDQGVADPTGGGLAGGAEDGLGENP